MRQKIQDLVLLLKKDRKTKIIAVLVVAALGYLLLADGHKRPRAKVKQAAVKEKAVNPNDETYNDIVTRFGQNLEELNRVTHETSKKVDEQSVRTGKFEESTANIFRRILERQAELEASVLNQPANNPAAAVDVGTDMPPREGGAEGQQEPPELETIGFDKEATSPPPPPAGPQPIAVVGAGDSVRVKLLAGVNAPTDGTPYPVVFKLVGDVAGPDGSTLPLGEARLIAAAQGSLTDSRALFRLTSLNIRLPNGKRKIFPVDGWIVGEDGIRGMEGMLLDPMGKAVMGGLLTGGLDGLGRGLSDSQVSRYTNAYEGTTQELVTGDELKYAEGKALSGAARKWDQFIRDRMALLVPHVEVLSGREGTAIFSKSFMVKDLYEQLDEDSQAFSSLD